MSEPILYFNGYRDALKEIESDVAHMKKLLDVKESTSPAGWQDAAFEYVLNVVRGKLNDLPTDNAGDSHE